MKQARFGIKTQQEDKNLNFSYAGDKPNPHLREFIEAHVREHPYNPKTDDYDVKAFDKPIMTTKATAIYNMHTYWSKKPHTAIVEYIRHYTKPGDLVLDSMCGSGGTALAALMEGRKAVAIDLSPAATFITKNYCESIAIDEIEEAYDKVKEKLEPELDWLYETRCDGCGGKATMQYIVYSQRFQCPRCLEIIPLFDCIEATVPVKTQKKDNPAEMKTIKICPHCKQRGHSEEISTRTKQFGTVPVLVAYECLGACKPKRRQRQYNDINIKKREFFEKYDLGKLSEIESKVIPHWYPPHRMMNVESDTEPWGDKWRAGTSNFRTVAELYTKANLWALSAIYEKILELEDQEGKNTLLFAWNSILLNMTKMTTNRDRLGFLKGTYYLPPEFRVTNVLDAYENKVQALKRGLQEIPGLSTNNIVVSTQSATDLNFLPTNSVDYVFTDPPYSGNVQYGELNFVWEAWLGFNTSWHDQEIIVNETRGVTEADWRSLMKQAMGEVFRVLKPGRWVSLCYHDASEGTWQLLQDLMAELGFIPSQTDSAIFIDTNQKSYNQKVADKVTKRDLVFNYRKPKPGESSSFLLLTGDEDPRSFNEKALAVIRDFLLENPGSTKDRVYDALVSHMVSRSQMQAHDFGSLLRIVADSTGGSGVAERWYLKDAELNATDVAETEKEDAASQSVGKFIDKYRKTHPEFEGVHYSDVFEYYIYSVKDKPMRALSDWLLDYFFITSDGTYRPPLTDEEASFKKLGRVRGLNRKIKRLVAFIVQGVPVPEAVRPDNLTLAQWVLHSRRAGLYLEGKLLFERAGLALDALGDEMQVELEEAYQTCNRMTTSQSN